jgi:hypothetical protein
VNLFTRLRLAWKAATGSAPNYCRTCGTTDKHVLAPGSLYCARCSHGSPKEQQSYWERQPTRSRRHDDPRFPFSPE